MGMGLLSRLLPSGFPVIDPLDASAPVSSYYENLKSLKSMQPNLDLMGNL
jgi:hypothetical protein